MTSLAPNQVQNPDGSWSDAIPEPYYPSTFEKIKHMFGFHIWTFTNPRKCVYPGCILVETPPIKK